MKSADMLGKTFGSLEVLRFVTPRGRLVVVLCKCGRESVHEARHIRDGRISRCVVCRRDTLSKRERLTKGSWKAMIRRCFYPSDEGERKYYFDSGITVCERWRKFENFIADMGPRPSSGHSIGRIDNKGNYEPGNCQWEIPDQQMNNTRANVFLVFEGHRMTISQWSVWTGISRPTIDNRIRKGWSVRDSLTRIASFKDNNIYRRLEQGR
jgi:hypothetical protein